MLPQQRQLLHRQHTCQLWQNSWHRRRPHRLRTSSNTSGTHAGGKSEDPDPQQQRSQQQPQPQLQYPPGYDPNAAAGFIPVPGEKPFWWVEKFEERRRKLAEEAAISSSTSSSTSSGTGSSSSTKPSPIGSGNFMWAVVQLLQLAVVNAALILWPASLYPGGLAVTQVWVCYWCYMLFFAGGSVYRLLKFGPLAARKKDKQSKTWWSTLSWILFVVCMPVIHWSPVVGIMKRQQQQTAVAAVAANGSSHSYITAYDLIGWVMLAGAVALNWWSAKHLGKAYDRVVQPDSLVTTGPYAYLQHPIYSSYMLLFVGYSMMLHSAPAAVLALVVCLVYYASRTRLERGVLQQAFGQQYADYAKRTKLFIPYLL